MKRKKWSEVEERTLLSKYSDLLHHGTLAKLKTREKKFKPIADHVNSVHHLRDPISFPFKWSWRDVSIKVQNMRHQYLGVKQKIRVSDQEFNWKDGENHWENFFKYKEVFGDVELDPRGKRLSDHVEVFESCDGGDDDGDDVFGLGLGFGIDSEDTEESDDEGDDHGNGNHLGDDVPSDDEFCGERGVGVVGLYPPKKPKKRDCEFGGRKVDKNRRRLGFVGSQVLELRDLMGRREEKRREREWSREKATMEREEEKRDTEARRDEWLSERDEGADKRERELEESHILWAKRESEKRLRLERDFFEERRRRIQLEEKREEEELEWRERMVGLQIEHEKRMMQMHAEACQNQMQILGVMARLVCQYFGSGNDGLGGGLALPPQVLQNLQHPTGLGDTDKPDSNSPPEFM